MFPWAALLVATLAAGTPLLAQDPSTVLPAPRAGQRLVELVRVERPLSSRLGTRSRGNLNLGMTTVAGDIDGDGFAEIAAGMPIKDHIDAAGNQVVQAGAVKVYRGSDMTEWMEIPHPEPTFQGRFGTSMIIADLDGDSFGDLVVTAWARPSQHPASWIYYGPHMTRVRCLAQPWKGRSGAMWNSFGIGDTNGDGNLDLVHANPGVFDPSFGGGAVFVYEGPELTNVRTIHRPDTATQLFGISCAVGDVNGDGFDDVVATDPLSDLPDGTPAQGRIWVFHGPTFRDHTVRNNPDGVAQTQFGETCVVGDFNADGFGDVVLGAPRASDGAGTRGGAVFVYWGPGLEESQVTRLVNTPTSRFGGAFGASLTSGDLNLDGVSDLLIGAAGAGHPDPWGVVRAGHVNILYGPDLAHSDRVYGPPASMRGSGGSIGRHVDVADVNGDGRLEIAMGAPLADSRLGRVYYAEPCRLAPFLSFFSPRVGDAAPMRISATGTPAPGDSFRVEVSSAPSVAPAWIWIAAERGASCPTAASDARLMGAQGPGRYLPLSPAISPLLLADLEDPHALTSATNRRQCEFLVPMDVTLLDQRVRMQAFALDPTDPLRLMESDGLVVTVADW